MPRQGWLFTHRGVPSGPALSLPGPERLPPRGQGLRDHRSPAAHYFGTAIYEASHDLRVTQELLGHQSPSTTSIYAAFSPIEAARAVTRWGLLRRESPG